MPILVWRHNIILVAVPVEIATDTVGLFCYFTLSAVILNQVSQTICEIATSYGFRVDREAEKVVPYFQLFW